MDTYKFEYLEEEKKNYWLQIALLLSLLVHIVILLIFQFSDAFIIDFSPDKEKEIPKEVTVVFPENKPKQVVENMNENELLPDFSDFLSDRSSQARNPNLLEQTGNMPFSEGNVPLANLSRPFSNPAAYNRASAQKKFTKDALTGEYTDNILQPNPHQAQSQNVQSAASEGTNNMLEQKQFSADDVGDISLSTYAWEWAPYINYFKKRLYQVWYVPAAYYRLGLIHGYSIIRFTMNREGSLLGYEVLQHEGHSSLQQSSVSAVNAAFPLKKLPAHFPEETLTLTLRMIYPNLRKGSK
jgi:outer membrane biosynthesis protein TonB